jgi:hypothetical protein
MTSTAGTDHITASDFQEWLAAARPGERIAYAKGALAASFMLPSWRSTPTRKS